VRIWLEKHAGMVDSPLLSRFDFAATLRRHQVQPATAERLAALSDAERQRSVVLVQDAFTRYFETPLAAAFVELAARMGFRVFLAPFRANGKPLQVQGFLRAFDRAAGRNAAELGALAAHGVPLVGLDPAMTLVYRQEYLKVEAARECPKVLLPQEWLVTALPEMPAAAGVGYRLMAHCTEKTNAPASTTLWQQVFARAGLVLQQQASGCCGMSGTYGHETRNRGTSEIIFDQSWGRILDQAATPDTAELLATGYSCRSQAKRLRQRALRHPIEVLLETLAN